MDGPRRGTDKDAGTGVADPMLDPEYGDCSGANRDAGDARTGPLSWRRKNDGRSLDDRRSGDAGDGK